MDAAFCLRSSYMVWKPDKFPFLLECCYKVHGSTRVFKFPKLLLVVHCVKRHLLSQAVRCFSFNSKSSGVGEPGLRLLKRISPCPPWPCSMIASKMVRLFRMSMREDFKMSSLGWNAARILTFWLAPIIMAIESLWGITPRLFAIRSPNFRAALSDFFWK